MPSNRRTHLAAVAFPADPTGLQIKEYRPLTVEIEESLQNTGFDDDYDGDDMTHPIRPAHAESRGKCADDSDLTRISRLLYTARHGFTHVEYATHANPNGHDRLRQPRMLQEPGGQRSHAGHAGAGRLHPDRQSRAC